MSNGLGGLQKSGKSNNANLLEKNCLNFFFFFTQGVYNCISQYVRQLRIITQRIVAARRRGHWTYEND